MPGKSKTFSKKNAPIPSAAKYERITAAMSTRGATIARRRAARIMKTTTSAIGTINLLSRAADSRRSCSSAVGPPTSTSSPAAPRAASGFRG